MRHWYTLKKGTEGVHVGYVNGETTLLADDFEIRPGDPLDVSLDLGRSLRTRNKQENTYIDAEDLSSKMETLKSVQIADKTVIDGVVKQLERLRNAGTDPKAVRLRVRLKGEYWYAVELHWQSEFSLMLNVLSKTEGD